MDNYHKLMREEERFKKAKMNKDFTGMEKHGFECNNLKGILLRQMTTGIYKEPNHRYIALKQDQFQIAQELQRITGNQIDLPHKNEMMITFKFLYQ